MSLYFIIYSEKYFEIKKQFIVKFGATIYL